MATTFVAQASDPATLRERMRGFVRSQGIRSEGTARAGSFARAAEADGSLPAIGGRYLVDGATVRFVTHEDLPPAVVFDRLVRAGLHLVSYQ